MSYLKFSENLFLGRQELQQLIKFLDTEGFRFLLKSNSGSFGLITDSSRNLNNNFYPQVGTNFNTLKYIEEGFAIDSDGNTIYQPIKDNIDISSINDSFWYWLKISHQFSPNELGVVSVSAAGILTGVGTKFTEILRGQTTGFPSKISFPSATLNTSSYEVQEVVSDTNAILSGSFQAESSQLHKVVGTFTPGSIQQPSDKDILQHDSVVFEFVPETVENTAPAGLVENKEFWIARIKNAGGSISIQDKRTSIWREKGLVLAEENKTYFDGKVATIEQSISDLEDEINVNIDAEILALQSDISQVSYDLTAHEAIGNNHNFLQIPTSSSPTLTGALGQSISPIYSKISEVGTLISIQASFNYAYSAQALNPEIITTVTGSFTLGQKLDCLIFQNSVYTRTFAYTTGATPLKFSIYGTLEATAQVTVWGTVIK